MTSYVTAQNVIYSNLSSNTDITLTASAGKSLVLNGTISSSNSLTVTGVNTNTLQVNNRPSYKYTGTVATTTSLTTGTWSRLTPSNMWTSSALTGTGIAVGVTTGAIKVTDASLYIVSSQLEFTASTQGSRGLALYKNNVVDTKTLVATALTGSTILNVSTAMNLATNDEVSVYAYHDSGVSLPITGLNGAYFQVVKM